MMHKETSLICIICGDQARGMNFDALTCMSCKAFFRRHALRSRENIRCLFEEKCLINKRTRGLCTACRLEKCFLVGMKPDLIRSPYKKKIKSLSKISDPKPLNLLNNDRSLLTIDEWNLLSNILNSYDEQNLVCKTQSCLQQQLALPPKVRMKKLISLELIGAHFGAVQPFLQHSSYFHRLPIDIQTFIIKNNLPGTGNFNTVIASIEANAFRNELYTAQCYQIYGEESVKSTYRIMERFEVNLSLLKILIITLAFSTNCSIVEYQKSSYTVISNVNYLLSIQNIFITMFWKYLIYQYGHENAVRHMMLIIKNYLDIIQQTHQSVSQQHLKMISNITGKILNSLVVNDPKNTL